MGRIIDNMRMALVLATILLGHPNLQGQYFPVLRQQNFFGKKGKDTPCRIVKAENGDLILGGHSETFDARGNKQTNIWILKVDTTGQELWEKELYLDGSQELRDMVITYEGGVICSGVTTGMIDHKEEGSSEFKADFFIAQLDPYGQLDWMKTYGGESQDQAFGIARGPYREYLVVGGSHSDEGDVTNNYGRGDIWMLKVDTKGNKRLSKVMGGTGSEWASAVQACNNGDYLLAGFTNSQSLGRKKLSSFGNGLVTRLDQSGETIWTQTFPCANGGYFTRIAEDSKGRIALVGSKETQNHGRQFWLVIMGAEGKVLADEVFGENGDDYLTALAATEDGGFLLGGYSTRHLQGKYAKGGEDMWLIRVDSLGKVIWRDTYGGPDNERCSDILIYRPGVIYALGEKQNDFNEEHESLGKDYWLLRIDEKPCDSIMPEMFVRARDNQTQRDVKIRFRARHQYGERFHWDFGDGTQSEEETPLKSYPLPGMYQIVLSIFINEGCQVQVVRDRLLEVY